MRKKLFLLLISISFLLISCGIGENKKSTKPEIVYNYTQITTIPDSNLVKMRDWIIKTVEATNKNMTGGDYEDPEDVIEQVEETANRLFSVKEDALQILSNGYWSTIPKNRMTKEELHILDSLKYYQR